MSLVGPRPCLPYEYEQYEEWYKKRVSVRPGITGVWQVTGRSEVAFEDMILLDLYYIYNRSVLLDFQVLLETANAVLKQKGILIINFSGEKFMKRGRAAQNSEKLKGERKKGLTVEGERR